MKRTVSLNSTFLSPFVPIGFICDRYGFVSETGLKDAPHERGLYETVRGTQH